MDSLDTGIVKIYWWNSQGIFANTFMIIHTRDMFISFY
jgi:hypothetical protein